VTERTREIGIRLAIGAVASEVLMQFLMEAVVLSCLGGLVGLLVAQLVVLGLAPLMRVEWMFEPQINVVAFGISALIGVVFGYFPARRAASLNPIDALRHESGNPPSRSGGGGRRSLTEGASPQATTLRQAPSVAFGATSPGSRGRISYFPSVGSP
jgi:hypothetical protein